MSVPYRTLENAKQLHDRILSFLHASPEQAFNLWEVYLGAYGYDAMTLAVAVLIGGPVEAEGRKEELHVVKYALDDLIRAKKVWEGTLAGRLYYYAAT
jgi:hypothetical protein